MAETHAGRHTVRVRQPSAVWQHRALAVTILVTIMMATAAAWPRGPETLLRPVARPAVVTLPAAATPIATAAVTSTPVSVTESWLRVVDSSRPTVSFGHELHPFRRLTTLLLRPGLPGPRPLVVFCHGFNITPKPYLDLLEHWVRAGFIVAAPYFPLTAPAAGRWLNEADVDNQPRDVSAVITAVERDLGALVDRRHVAVAGHSDGGSTSFAVGFSNKVRDARVGALLVFSGDERPRLAPFRAVSRRLPFMEVQSDRDEFNPLSSATAVWSVPAAPKIYLHLYGARHLPPFAYPCPWRPIVEAVTTDFLRGWIANDPRPETAALMRDGTRRSLSSVTSVA